MYVYMYLHVQIHVACLVGNPDSNTCTCTCTSLIGDNTCTCTCTLGCVHVNTLCSVIILYSQILVCHHTNYERMCQKDYQSHNVPKLENMFTLRNSSISTKCKNQIKTLDVSNFQLALSQWRVKLLWLRCCYCQYMLNVHSNTLT